VADPITDIQVCCLILRLNKESVEASRSGEIGQQLRIFDAQQLHYANDHEVISELSSPFRVVIYILPVYRISCHRNLHPELSNDSALWRDSRGSSYVFDFATSICRVSIILNITAALQEPFERRKHGIGRFRFLRKATQTVFRALQKLQHQHLESLLQTTKRNRLNVDQVAPMLFASVTPCVKLTFTRYSS